MILIYQVLIFKSLFVKYFDLYIHCITFKVRNEFNLVVFIIYIVCSYIIVIITIMILMIMIIIIIIAEFKKSS